MQSSKTMTYVVLAVVILIGIYFAVFYKTPELTPAPETAPVVFTEKTGTKDLSTVKVITKDEKAVVAE